MPIDMRDVRIIINRQHAITQAIALAQKGDIVLITGKGHEQSMNYGHGEDQWSDNEGGCKGSRVKERGNVTMQKVKHIHFVGIKGVGMTPLAIIAKEAKITVTGSDVDEKFITDCRFGEDAYYSSRWVFF